MKSTLLIILLGTIFSSFSQPFTLPKLPFSYQEYAPYIDAQTMEIHLTKHHQAYVNNLNKAIKDTRFAGMGLEELLMELRLEDGEVIRNNAGGHYNHSLFWNVLAPPAKQGKAQDRFLTAVQQDFGNLDSLKKEMNKAAMTRFGSGWSWLIVTPKGSLSVVSTPNQDNPLMNLGADRGIPILGIDVWEHAYYLNYQNRRADYLTAVWSLVDWSKVSENFDNAKANETRLMKLVSTKKGKKRKQ
ncbi:MAG: superoxide dismutase [Flavobacteriales bacterium]|jgi:Fe-Mn family superoxide dismutase